MDHESAVWISRKAQLKVQARASRRHRRGGGSIVGGGPRALGGLLGQLGGHLSRCLKGHRQGVRFFFEVLEHARMLLRYRPDTGQWPGRALSSCSIKIPDTHAARSATCGHCVMLEEQDDRP
jgi:hypothetical protein